MNNFFGTQFSQQDLQQRLADRRQNAASRTASSSMAPPAGAPQNDDTMDMSGMMPNGDSLDDIIMQNNHEMHRRQSIPQNYAQQEPNRRASMLNYASGNGTMNDYHFGQGSAIADDSQMGLRRPTGGEMSMEGGYVDMSSGMNMAGQQLGYPNSMQIHEPLHLNTNSHYPGMSEDMMQNMMGYSPIGMEDISGENAGMNMFSPTGFSQTYGNEDLNISGNFLASPNIADGLPSRRGSMADNKDKDMATAAQTMAATDHLSLNTSQNAALNRPTAAIGSPIAKTSSYPEVEENSFGIPGPPTPDLGVDNTFGPKPKPKSSNSFDGIYSSSGFDMLGALMKVATRQNPEINIGKVDMSCAFVVCDMALYDCPIIYVSDIFERLTGYSKHEVKGQNCRFLQSPDGKIEAGTHREFVDNDSVYYLRKRITGKKEAQRSLINYRKGGQPFMNLLTMIPITGEDNKEMRYYVGFQVDLVAKPTSVESKSASGVYTVDYSQGTLPKYIWQPPEASRPLDGGQTISRDDVSTVLTSINNIAESEITKRMWDKVLLENTDDVVHVLSLKGLFLYLSPSSRNVLEYDASELVGTALSSICHPSDIVPVTRELKDTTTGVPVNVVFRIRRKKSGYTWFESHGSLCVEQGKGRKCIILVGRERPVYALHRHDIEVSGGIGENEMWTKLSTSGMFLFVSSSVRALLDRSPDELMGTSIQALMRSESRIEFGRSLEKARTGKQITHKHEILNKRGLVLQAQTVLYPGDASEGHKPTFLVAQTRLLKLTSRPVVPAVGSHGKSVSLIQGMDHRGGGELVTSPVLSSSIGHDVTSPARSALSAAGIVTQAGGSGLAIGHQDLALASEDNIFDELKTTRCTSWQFELRQMEKSNRLLAEELAVLMASKKKRKRRKGAGHSQRDCANCHTRSTPEWRRGPSGQRDLCNSCGLRWAKQTGRVSPRNTSSKQSPSQTPTSPVPSSPSLETLQSTSNTPNLNADQKGDVKGDGAAMPESLGGRSTMDSMPVHTPSQGFREGGKRKITNIDETDEGIT